MPRWPRRRRPRRPSPSCVSAARSTRSTSTLAPALAVLDGSSTDPAGYELAQDFLRDAGDLEGAQDVALEWVEAHADDGLAYQRLAEIDLLADDPERAEAELGTALPLLEAAAAAYDVSNASVEPNPVKDLATAELQLGLALDQQGEDDDALSHYAAASAALAPLAAASDGLSPESGTYPGDLEAYAHSQAGAVLASARRPGPGRSRSTACRSPRAPRSSRSRSGRPTTSSS